MDEPQRGPSEEGAAGTEVGGGNREADDPQAGGPAQAGGPPQTGEPAQTGGPAQLPPQQGVINQPENIRKFFFFKLNWVQNNKENS